MEENRYSLLSLNRKLAVIDEGLAAKEREFVRFQEDCRKTKREICEAINLVKHSLDVEKFAHGLAILHLQFPGTRQGNDGPTTYTTIYASLINEAKRDLANGAPRLKKVYFGQKYYEGYDQREDHEYGMGPRHGNIYQRIGLKNPNADLSDYDIECALYVLENIDVQLENLNAKR